MWSAKPLSSIELRHLRYFLAAAENGSFRKAGIAMAVQESSISRRIRDLEDRLGASLFQRSNGGVTLTVAGRQFLREARMAMKHLGDGAMDVRSIGQSESGHLRVGIFSSLASGFLADLFRTYNADLIGMRIDFSEGHITEHVAAIRLQQLDIAFVAGMAEYARCETTHLWSEQVFVALPAAHRLADQGSVFWDDLIGETFIVMEQGPGREKHDFLIKRLSDLGRDPEVRRQNVGRDNLMSLVAIGRGLALTSEASTSTAFFGVVYRPIVGETLPFSAAWSPKNNNPALHLLLSMARARSRVGAPAGLPGTVP